MADSLKVDRYCGRGLGACQDDTCSSLALGPVRTSVIPFTMGVVTDATEDLTVDIANRGFELIYKQQPCAG